MDEAISYKQAHSTETFTEPQVHPDIDSYFREKLAQATAIKQRQDTLRAKGRKFAQRLDTVEANEALLSALANAGKIEEAEKIAREWNVDVENRSLSPEGEVQRLQELWSEAARGDLTAASIEIAHDIANVTTEQNKRRQSREPDIQADIERHNALAAALAEWHTSLQETPVDVNSRLGRQINRTVVGLIQQRDNTQMGTLNKQLKNLQRVQNITSTLQSLPKGK